MKYILKKAPPTFAKKYCPVGKFASKGHSKGDLLLKVAGTPASELYINAEMLREAMIENIESVREILELDIKDLRIQRVKKENIAAEANDVFETIQEEPAVLVQEIPAEEPTVVAEPAVVKKPAAPRPKKVVAEWYGNISNSIDNGISFIRDCIIYITVSYVLSI